MRGFITLAFGSRDYLEMASALIASYRRFSSDIPFAVVTNWPGHRLLRDFDVVVPLDPSLGRGVVQKLHLDGYSPFSETLFVDCDCLFYKDPELLWPLYAPFDDFGVKGFRYLGPDANVAWMTDTKAAMAAFGVSRLPNLNGGIYYFRKTERAFAVFDTARRAYHDRNLLGLLPFKGAPIADEIAVALAMERVGIELLPWDNGRAMDMTFQMELHHEIDISQPSAKFSVHGRTVDPIVIHFNVGAQYSSLYAMESAKVRWRSQPAVVATIAGRAWRMRKNTRRLVRRAIEELLSARRPAAQNS